MQQTLSGAGREEQFRVLWAAWKLLEVPEGHQRPRAWSIGCHTAAVEGHGRRESAAQRQQKAQNQHWVWSRYSECRYSGHRLVLTWKPSEQGPIVRVHLHGCQRFGVLWVQLHPSLPPQGELPSSPKSIDGMDSYEGCG
jgi:hypothetical protein